MNDNEFGRDIESVQKNHYDIVHEVYAELWQRVVAYLINMSGMFLFMWLIFIIGTGSLFPHIGNMKEGELIEVLFLYLITYFGVLHLYIFRSDYNSERGTFGERCMKIKVVDLEGKNLSHRRAFLRGVGMMLTCLTLFIGFFIAASREDKRTLHDRIAGTKVVKRHDKRDIY